jgi:hypothetical protein
LCGGYGEIHAAGAAIKHRAMRAKHVLYCGDTTLSGAADVAPHWVGGLVDWGDGERVTARAPGSWEIEVGNFYSQLVANLLAWTGQLGGESVE